MRLLICFLVLVLSSVPAPISAQSAETGSIIPKSNAVTNDNEGKVRGDKARRVADGFATCMVGRHYNATLKVLNIPFSSPERAKAIANLMDRECLNNGLLSFSSTAIQGSLYKALFLREFRSKLPQFNENPLDFEKLEMAKTQLSFASPASEVLNFAGCIVRLDTINSKSLMLSPAGTKSELIAMDALRPAMTKCIKGDQQLSFDKSYFVGALAEAFYREAQAFNSAGVK